MNVRFLPFFLSGAALCACTAQPSRPSADYVPDASGRSTVYNMPDSLQGHWQAQRLEGYPVNTADYRLRQPTMELLPAEGRVMGNSGCNLYRGTISVENRQIRFSQLIAGTHPCSTRQLERAFLNVLNGRELNYRLQGQELRLYNGDREVVLFTRMK